MNRISEKFTSFKKIDESVQNAFEYSDKKKYADQVWDIIQKAYEPMGGIFGSGFRSVDDMIQNIPFWKIEVVNGEVLCVAMYKFEPTKTKGISLRKRVAIGKLFDRERKDFIQKKFINLIKEDFERSIVETSGGSESFLKKNFGSMFDKYKIPVEQVKKILFDDEIRGIDQYKYERKIGGNWHEKTMVGTPTKRF